MLISHGNALVLIYVRIRQPTEMAQLLRHKKMCIKSEFAIAKNLTCIS